MLQLYYHNTFDIDIGAQLKVNELSTSVKELQSVSKILKRLERSWQKSDPTAYRRWFSAFVDFYEGQNEGDLLKDVTQIANQWNFGTYNDVSNHIYESGSFCLSTTIDPQPDFVFSKNNEIFIVELKKASEELNLIDTDSFDVHNFSTKFKEDLAAYQKTQDELYLVSAAHAFFYLKLKSERVKREKLSGLLALKKQCLQPATRDLRQSFRKIIKFLFKNMEADEDSRVLFTDRFKQTSLLTSTVSHEHRTNHQTFRQTYSRR